jgi:hypothetical protein
MIAQCSRVCAIFVCIAGIGRAAEPRPMLPPQPTPQPAADKRHEVSAIEHMRMAAAQLEAAGLTVQAATIRTASEQLERQATQAIADITHQIAELKQRSQKLQQLIGKPNRIAYRCRFLELSTTAVAEFYAAAELTARSALPRAATIPCTTVCRKAEEAYDRLRQAGKIVTLAKLNMVAACDQAVATETGGEFPIWIPVADQKLGVEHRSFGYRCQVHPQPCEPGKLRLEFTAEIGERDFRNSVQMHGFSVPGLTTRRVGSVIELNLGETIVLNAGQSPENREDAVRASALQTVSGWIGAEPRALPTRGTVTLITLTPIVGESTE